MTGIRIWSVPSSGQSEPRPTHSTGPASHRIDIGLFFVHHKHGICALSIQPAVLAEISVLLESRASSILPWPCTKSPHIRKSRRVMSKLNPQNLGSSRKQAPTVAAMFILVSVSAWAKQGGGRAGGHRAQIAEEFACISLPIGRGDGLTGDTFLGDSGMGVWEPEKHVSRHFLCQGWREDCSQTPRWKVQKQIHRERCLPGIARRGRYLA